MSGEKEKPRRFVHGCTPDQLRLMTALRDARCGELLWGKREHYNNALLAYGPMLDAKYVVETNYGYLGLKITDHGRAYLKHVGLEVSR